MNKLSGRRATVFYLSLLSALIMFTGHAAGRIRAQQTPQQGGGAGGGAVQQRRCPERPPLKTVYLQPNDPKKIDYIAEARLEDGYRFIYIDARRWEPLHEVVKDFIYNHELGHHVLGHAKQLAAAGGILDPHTRRQHEEQADCYAAHTFAARLMSEEIKLVENYIATLSPSEHWRRGNIGRCFANAGYKPQGPDDANAQSYLILDRTNPIYQPCGDPALLSYRAVYRNGGKIPLQCEVTVASGHFPRTAADSDSPPWLPFETRTHRFKLQPGEREVVRGYLTWYRVEDTMPRITLPRPNGDDGYVKCTFASGAGPTPPPPRTLDLKAALPRLIEASTQGFAALFGPRTSEDKQYKSLLGLPDAESCTIRITGDSEPEYTCSLKRTNDRQVVEKQYQEIVGKVKAWLPEGWTTEEDIEGDKKTFEAGWKEDDGTGPGISYNRPRISVAIYVRDGDRSSEQDKYTLTVDFTGEWGGDLKPRPR